MPRLILQEFQWFQCVQLLRSVTNVDSCPHQTQPTISHMASLHLAATQLHATKPCELNNPSPRIHAVFSNPPPAEGLFRLLTAPGLGLDIDEAALAQRRVDLLGTR